MAMEVIELPTESPTPLLHCHTPQLPYEPMQDVIPLQNQKLPEFRHFYYENENYFFVFAITFLDRRVFFLGIGIFFDENPRAVQKYQLFY